MSRSGYTDDCYDQWSLIRWRGAVKSSLRGRRGQTFLREALAALDDLPKRELIANSLIQSTEEGSPSFCMLGAVARKRQKDVSGVDVEDHERVAVLFGIPHALACEIMYMNDEGGLWDYDERSGESPAMRWARMRRWIVSHIKENET